MVKRRDSAASHFLLDIIRGDGVLFSDLTNAENAGGTDYIDWNSDGIGYKNGLVDAGANNIVWLWDAGTSTVSNTDGSVTSSVRANASAGFSIVTYTNPSSGTFTVGHGLNADVGMIITKHRNRSSDWYVWHSSFDDEDDYINLNSTSAKASATDFWGTSAPGSSTFGGKIGTSALAGDTDVAYCFAPVAGFSAFGEYTGNGSSSDGPFVYTGFRPRWLMVKQSSTGVNDWQIIDTARSEHNPVDVQLFANLSSAELTNSTNRDFDLLSNGFKIRGNNGGVNAGSATYIWAAFAENPLQANGGLAR